MSTPVRKPEEYSDIPKIDLPAGGFRSDIPPHLLEGRSDGDIWLLEKSSKMDNFIEWAGPILVDINRHQRITNGRVNLHDEQIEKNTKILNEFENQSKDAKEVVSSVKTFFQVVKSKAFWGGVIIFLVFILPWIQKHAPNADVLVKKLFGA